ncbi:MAG: glycosyltransferase family 2 protein [Bacteroides sp.]
MILTLPKVTVIIPIFNTEKYLSEALDSICKQTLRELQIILIDDGSTDNSPQIMEKYAARDMRIQIITQTNQGQGAARNHGLKNAEGEYIYFMDSDDVLEATCLEECYNICKSKHLDYVTFDAQIISHQLQNRFHFNYNRTGLIDASRLWRSNDLLEHTLSHYCFSSSVCLLFIQKSSITHNQIKFPEGIIHEDNVFVLHLMLCSKQAMYLPHAYFQRRVRDNSTMTTKFGIKNINSYIKVAECANKLLLSNPAWKPLIDQFLKNTFNSVIWQGHKLNTKDKISTFRLLYSHSLIKYGSLKNWLVFWLKKA